MTDRELLELAAKAAGICYQCNRYKWDPLSVEKDSFDLSKKIDCHVIVDGVYIWAEVRSIFGNVVCTSEKLIRDDYANDWSAGRRAIVMLAAAIGEQMK